VRRSWRSSSLVAGVALLALPTLAPLLLQAPAYRVTYHVRVVARDHGDTRLIASGVVSGPQDTNLRLALATDTAEVAGLLEILPEPDTVTLSGTFLSRRRSGRSRRGLVLWEEDTYRRAARLPWGAATRLYPFGAERSGQRRALWIELAVDREPAAGETRPSEELTRADSSVDVVLGAVTRPRRVLVRLTLVRGDTASPVRVLDLVPEAPSRRVTFGRAGPSAPGYDVSLVWPDPPTTGRDSALALDADAVCLRLTVPEASESAQIRCGRLDNVGRRVALASGDTLVAIFAWPGVR
jgi:hypothetical protein